MASICQPDELAAFVNNREIELPVVSVLGIVYTLPVFEVM